MRQSTWLSGVHHHSSSTVYHPAFAQEVPYVVALVELVEGPRLLSNIVGVPCEAVACDMPVKVVFGDVAADVSLPKFTPLNTTAEA
ncbi:MAG TPA: OB-fold domain-containing protein [Xanthobacteraceae bacterium]